MEEQRWTPDGAGGGGAVGEMAQGGCRGGKGTEEMSTPTPGGGGCVDALCDDVLASILVRLPSTSLLRCRDVCRSWRRVATDRSFLAAHRPLQMLTRTGSFCGRAASATPLSIDDDPRPPPAPKRLVQRTQQYEPSVPRSEDVLCSLDGLLVLTQRTGHYVVCNPATRQWTYLPALAPEPKPRRFEAIACGFYSHASSGEYRLLCHVRHKWERYYWILSAGGALPRRCHGRRAPRLTNRSYGRRGVHYSAPVSLRGVLHWLTHPEAAYTGKMLAFDTASEAFRLMPRPPERAGDRDRELLELDGELAMAVMQQGESSLAVWDLRDYGEAEEDWTLRYHVELPPPASFFGDITKTIWWFFSVGDGAIILIGYGSSYRARLYDLKEKRIREQVFVLPRDQEPASLVFRESLVSHAFFDLPPSSEVIHIQFSD